MNEKYWDRVAPSYQAQVHDSLAHDRDGTLLRWLDRLGSKRRGVIDFGTGVGRYLRALSPRFREVQALDHSAHCLKIAARAHRDLGNINYRKVNLTRPLPRWRTQPIGVCMNVLIAPSHQVRCAMLRTMHDALTAGGHLLALVPAFESALYVDTRLVEWNMREGLNHRRAVSKAVRDEPGVIGHAVHGVVDRGGEPTKHYLREEAIVQWRGCGFDVEHVDRVQYAWSEEFNHPPRWLADPFPWHWLLVCRRR